VTPLKLKVIRRVEIAPGIVNYELDVTNRKHSVPEPKIDRRFAESFAKRLQREAKRIPGFARNPLVTP
jgi:hypothetical protein